MQKQLGIIVCTLTLCGCAIHQNVKPVAQLEDKEVCIIESSSVKTGVLEAYKRTLLAKGYQVKQLPPLGLHCRLRNYLHVHRKLALGSSAIHGLC